MLAGAARVNVRHLGEGNALQVLKCRVRVL